jgi:hypothetical protein
MFEEPDGLAAALGEAEGLAELLGEAEGLAELLGEAEGFAVVCALDKAGSTTYFSKSPRPKVAIGF